MVFRMCVAAFPALETSNGEAAHAVSEFGLNQPPRELPKKTEGVFASMETPTPSVP